MDNHVQSLAYSSQKIDLSCRVIPQTYQDLFHGLSGIILSIITSRAPVFEGQVSALGEVLAGLEQA